MSAVFVKILNMSIAASWLIAVVLLLRPFLRKAPRWISCILWALVALRLVIPFTFESALSAVPSSETISVDTSGENAPQIHTGISAIDQAVGNAFSQGDISEDPSSAAESGKSESLSGNDFLKQAGFIGSIVWVAGISVMLFWGLMSFLQIRKRTLASVRIRDRVLACDEVTSPFILGVLKPRIYVPSDLGGAELDYALAHEEAHIRRHDHWWKPLGFLILSVYWFNPLCWVAYILLCRDIEFACDEKVIQEMGGHHVKEYSRALLDLSLMRRRITACPLAFGEMSVKQRVKRILNYKKPAFWVIIVSLVVCAALAVCFLTDPKGKAQGSTDGSETADMGTDAQTDHEKLPSESEEPTTVPTIVPTETATETPAETRDETFYGSLSMDEEATVCQVAMEHFHEVLDEMFPKERRNFAEEDLIAVVDPAVRWGECFRHGAPEWKEYTEKYGLKGHPDRIASVGIEVRPGAEGSTLGYSVFMVKPLNTDTWIIVNYGF